MPEQALGLFPQSFGMIVVEDEASELSCNYCRQCINTVESFRKDPPKVRTGFMLSR